MLETGKHTTTQSPQKVEDESLSKARHWVSGYEYSSEKYRLCVNCIVAAENVLVVKANYFQEFFMYYLTITYHCTLQSYLSHPLPSKPVTCLFKH